MPDFVKISNDRYLNLDMVAVVDFSKNLVFLGTGRDDTLKVTPEEAENLRQVLDQKPEKD